jgi:hypothetical protein
MPQGGQPRDARLRHADDHRQHVVAREVRRARGRRQGRHGEELPRDRIPQGHSPRGGRENETSGNEVFTNHDYGIEMAAGSAANLIARNSVWNNRDEGIHVGAGVHDNRVTNAGHALLEQFESRRVEFQGQGFPSPRPERPGAPGA